MISCGTSASQISQILAEEPDKHSIVFYIVFYASGSYPMDPYRDSNLMAMPASLLPITRNLLASARLRYPAASAWAHGRPSGWLLFNGLIRGLKREKPGLQAFSTTSRRNP
jgi:hypothetical protein